MNASKRQDWIDIVKGFSIILVVLGHIRYNYPTHGLFPVPYIYSWHIRVFFLVAGFFLLSSKLEKPGTFILGKFKKLYLPLLYIYVPATLLHNQLIDWGWYAPNIEYGGRLVTSWGGDYTVNTLKTVFFMGSEPSVGALWFAYVLFMALCLISIVSYIGKLIWKTDEQKKERFAVLTLLGIALLSTIATNHFGVTIPRISLVMTSAWLIYTGKLVLNKWKVGFDNGFVFTLCLIGLYSIAVMRKLVKMDGNEAEVVSLTVSSLMALYILAFIAQKCKGAVAKLLALIGRESFYIMGLHFVAFKACYYVLNAFGYHQNIAELAPEVNNLGVLLFYLAGLEYTDNYK